MRVVEDDLSGAEIATLLREHVRDMYATSPEDGVHTLSIDKLRAQEITVWTAWDDATLLGCGALKQIDAKQAEIKSMRTANAHRGRGVAQQILKTIVDVSRSRQYRHLYLETGSSPAFAPAHLLYQKAGFVDCGPFEGYVEDPFSRFMVMKL